MALGLTECLVEYFKEEIGVGLVDAHWRRKTDRLPKEAAFA
jgi:hypothetical protein